MVQMLFVYFVSHCITLLATAHIASLLSVTDPVTVATHHLHRDDKLNHFVINGNYTFISSCTAVLLSKQPSTAQRVLLPTG